MLLLKKSESQIFEEGNMCLSRSQGQCHLANSNTYFIAQIFLNLLSHNVLNIHLCWSWQILAYQTKTGSQKSSQLNTQCWVKLDATKYEKVVFKGENVSLL